MKTATSSRANNLLKMRDLIVLGVENEVTDRSTLVDIAVAKGILVTEENGKPYDYSSVYRYLDSIRFLRFEQAGTIGDPIVWSAAAKELAQASKSSSANQLSDDEKAIFRTCIVQSEANKQFLACFCPSGESPISASDFADRCRPLYILRLSKRLSNSSERSVEFTNAANSQVTFQKPAMEFLYTYRLWCLDAGLIDEINIKEARRSGIAAELSHVLYPVRSSHSFTTAAFLELLYTFKKEPLKPIVVSIPELLYTLCPDLRLPVQVFLDLLVETWRTNRHLLHLERGPGILVRGDLAAKERPQSERFGNHRFYIIMDGTVRSNLILLPRRT